MADQLNAVIALVMSAPLSWEQMQATKKRNLEIIQAEYDRLVRQQREEEARND